MPEKIKSLTSQSVDGPSETFSVNMGITDEQKLQLIELTSSDSEVAANTSDPVRFANRESLEKWLGKEGDRIIYTLTNQVDRLCGIVWFSKKTIPDKNKILDYESADYEITFAIRTYRGARGKGVASEFFNTAINDFMNSDWYKKSPQKGIWLETNNNYLPAVKLYEKTGWIHASQPDEKGRILMIYK